MKTPTLSITSIAIALLLVLAACQNPTQDSSAAASSAKATGTLSVIIPAIATGLTAQTKGDDTSARVYGYATSYYISVYNSSGSYVLSSTNGTTLGVPVGSNYTVNISVYNSAVSTYSPTVTGVATGVNIADGTTTSVGITCTPYYPTTLYTGASAATKYLAARGETYYDFYPTAGNGYVFTQTTSGMAMGLFDSTGAAISNWSSSGSIAWTAPSTNKVYIGLTNTSTTTGATASLTAGTTNEGSSTTPTPLTVGASHSFQALGSGSSGTSYYSFTPSVSGAYELTLGSATTYNAALYIGSFTGTQVLASTAATSGVVSLGTLTASTTYYLKLVNTSTSALASLGFIPIPLAAGATSYVAGNIASGTTAAYYVATVAGGSTHTLNWDDYWQGSGVYSLDIKVTAYQANRTTSYTFTNYDSAYTTPQSIVVPSGDTKLYIKVEPYSYGTTGTFALKLQ